MYVYIIVHIYTHMLGIIYRYSRARLNVAGICPIEVEGVENIDLSDIILSHGDYGKSVL